MTEQYRSGVPAPAVVWGFVADPVADAAVDFVALCAS
jgi:hypothetical protein